MKRGSRRNQATSVEDLSTGETRSRFNLKTPPVQLVARARKIPTWRAEDGAANPVPQSPVKSQEAEEEIRLIPYAAAKLRITAFPRLD